MSPKSALEQAPPPAQAQALGWRRLTNGLRDVPAKDIDLGAGAALTVIVRFGAYVLVAIAGIIVARALGAQDRGVYSLVTTIALMFAAFAELGISKAGIYFMGKDRYSRQTVMSNNLAWLVGIGVVWLAGTMAVAAVRPPFVPDELRLPHFVIFSVGGIAVLFLVFAEDLLIASGSVLSYNLVRFLEPFLRAVLVMGGILIFGLGIVGVLATWLVAILLAGLLAVVLVSKRTALIPRVDAGALKAQLSFGLRSNVGSILESANHRVDVFIVAAMAGTAALGHYAVAFGVAELLWRLPFALGAVFFPKVSALDADASAKTTATTCRRAVFILILGTLTMLPVGRFMIGTLYGSEFLPALNAFYILAPSALVYTVYRLLSASLAAGGRPEAGVYAGLASVPVNVGLAVLLIPRMGIEGAAVASMTAYSISAAVVLVPFLRTTRQTLVDTLLIKRDDISSSVQSARALLVRGQS